MKSIINCRYYKRPVIPLLIGLIVGIILGEELPGYILAVSFSLVVCICLGLAAFVQNKPIRFTPLILFSALGYLLIQPCVSSVPPGHHIFSYRDGQKYNVTGTVESRPAIKGYRQTFILNTETISGDDLILRGVNGRVRVTIRSIPYSLKQGDKIGFKSKLRSFRNFYNPGGFDYERYMRFKGVHVRAYAHKDNLVLLSSNEQSFTNNARFSVEAIIDKSIKLNEIRAVLKALVTGNRNGIDHNLREAFNRTGTGHLLAISGLHIGIVASTAFFVFCWLISFYEGFLWNGYVKKIAGILSLIPVLVYGVLSGMSPSTQRAVIMVSVFLLTYSFETEHDIINTLALAALLILASSPASLYFVSFQLSFSAAFTVIYGMSNIRFKDDFQGNRAEIFKKVLKSYSLVSIFAFTGTLPLVLYYFNQASLIGIAANFILIPLVGFLVVPFGLAAVFVYPINHACSEILIKIAGYFLGNSLSIIHVLSEFSFSAIKTITPSVLEIICYYCLLILGFRTINSNNSKDKSEWKIVKILFTVVFVVILFDIGFWVSKRFLHDDLKVTILDVGQGSSTLLEFPGGECMLVDGGGFSDNSSFDIGEKIIAPFLWKKKIGKIQTVVLSHPESDHLNGLLYVLKNFNVENVWSNGDVKTTKGFREFRSIVEQKKINILFSGKSLKRINKKNGVSLKVLWPAVGIPGEKKMSMKNTNNNSIVLRVEYGSVSFLLPGDIMAKAEKKIIGLAGETLHSTVLVAPHHGSKTSSTKEFLDMVNPEIVIISCGWKNRFGMPHAKVLERLNELKTQVYRTDHDGAISISTSGSNNRIETVFSEIHQ